MKIKSLQISVLALFFGVFTLFFTQKAEANNVAKLPETGQIDGQNHQDFTGKKTKKSKKTALPKRGNARLLSGDWKFNGVDNASGKIMGIAYDSDAKTVYAGTAYSGVWKSTDGGNNWSKMAVENNKNLFVTCMAFDASKKIIYVGTGGDFKGQGIYKSENGAPFKLISGSETWNNVNKIAFYGDVIYAATNSGLMCYKDETWIVCTGTNETGAVTLDKPVRDISINSAGLVIIATNGTSCYISKTGAPDAFVHNVPLTFFTASAANISVTTSPVDNNILYVAGVKPSNGRLDNLLLSEDQGETWEVIYMYFAPIDLLEGNGEKINHIFADPKDPYVIYVASRSIWKGKRYAPGYYDFGLSSICQADALNYDNPAYMHSNINDLFFYGTSEGDLRTAYIATDGGVYNSIILIDPANNTLTPIKLLKNMLISSYDFIAPSSVPGNEGQSQFLTGTPTLGVNSIGITSNYNIGARPVWALGVGTDFYSSEGKGGPCAVSLINPSYFIYSLEQQDAIVKQTGAIDYKTIFTIRRTEDEGYSYQPVPGTVPVQWMTDTVLKPELNFISPILMWESFNMQSSPDSVWFKADFARNYIEGDMTIFAQSNNYGYPIPHTLSEPLNNGDSVQVKDIVQNKVFFANLNKLYMTREALDFSKSPATWYQIATLNATDTASFFAISDDGNDLFVGSRLGNIYHVTGLLNANDYATAAVASPNSQVTTNVIHKFDKKVLSVAVDPQNTNHVVVVLDGDGDNVFETYNATDAAATFKSIKGNLPTYVYTAIISKRDDESNGAIIVGTEKGIWTRAKDATEWSLDSNGIGEMPVKTLVHATTYRPAVKGVPYFNASTNKVERQDYPSNDFNYLAIYAGTYGAGVFSYGENKAVGIDENNSKLSDALTVIPNPVIDMATIKLNVEKESAFLQIFDVTGRCVKEQTVTDNDVQISFKDYEAGVYIIRVRQGDVVKSAKVVKQ